jgi:hypothetical protein
MAADEAIIDNLTAKLSLFLVFGKPEGMDTFITGQISIADFTTRNEKRILEWFTPAEQTIVKLVLVNMQTNTRKFTPPSDA